MLGSSKGVLSMPLRIAKINARNVVEGQRKRERELEGGKTPYCRMNG